MEFTKQKNEITGLIEYVTQYQPSEGGGIVRYTINKYKGFWWVSFGCRTLDRHCPTLVKAKARAERHSVELAAAKA